MTAARSDPWLAGEVALVRRVTAWTVDPAAGGAVPAVRVGWSGRRGPGTMLVRPDGPWWTAVVALCRRREATLAGRHSWARR